MLIVGIDPGQTGAVVALEGPDLHSVHVMKDATWFADHMEALKKYAVMEFVHGIKVYIERAQAMPKNGAVSMFKYGQHFGELIGILVALQIPFETVPPGTWTKAMHQTRDKTKTPKARSLQAVQRLYPGLRLTDPESERAKVPHLGIVDALLIATYGLNK